MASVQFFPTLPGSGSMRSGRVYERPMLARRTGGNGSSSWPTSTGTDAKSSGASGYSTESGRHSGTTLTDAIREWPTPSAEPYGTNQGGGMGRVGPVRPGLDTLAREWATPNAHERAQTPREVDHGIQLANQASVWSTPNAHDGRRPGADTESTQGANLSRDASSWGTPRARDAKGVGYSDSLPAQAIAQAGSDGSPQEGRPRLNPRFVEALMGFPQFWTRAWTSSDASETPSCPPRPHSLSESSR